MTKSCTDMLWTWWSHIAGKFANDHRHLEEQRTGRSIKLCLRRRVYKRKNGLEQDKHTGMLDPWTKCLTLMVLSAPSIWTIIFQQWCWQFQGGKGLSSKTPCLKLLLRTEHWISSKHPPQSKHSTVSNNRFEDQPKCHNTDQYRQKRSNEHTENNNWTILSVLALPERKLPLVAKLNELQTCHPKLSSQ